MEILIPGHRNDSGQMRIRMARENVGHLPAWRCESLGARPFYICGKCFGKRGSGPYTSNAEVWMAGTDKTGAFHYDIVPADALCQDCGHRAWPAD